MHQTERQMDKVMTIASLSVGKNSLLKKEQ